MVSLSELRSQAERRYPAFLRSIVENASFFPLDLRIGKTKRAEGYAERAAELSEFRNASASLGLTVDWQQVNDQRFGSHERPERAFFAGEEEYLRAIGKLSEVQSFREDLLFIRQEFDVLEPWLPLNVQSIVSYHGVWPELLRVVHWFLKNPDSGLYLRQLPIEGVDTKFFEKYQGILGSLIFQINTEIVDTTQSRFESRHKIRWEEPLIRLRFLDIDLRNRHGFPISDLAIPAPTFRSLPLGRTTVFITENLRNFLSLPPLPNAIAVQGSGDAASLLMNTPWLAQSRILYWGDMDPRGFAILTRLRGEYPHIESIMMDLSTWETHRKWAVKVNTPQIDISPLSVQEDAALKCLMTENLRLEQERIPFHSVLEAIAARIGEIAL